MRALTLCILALILAAPTSWAGPKEGKKDANAAISKVLISKFDTNSDGKIADGELKAARKAMNSGDAKMLKLFDENGDGKLKGAERAAVRKALGIQSKKAKAGEKKQNAKKAKEKKHDDDDDHDDDDHDDDDDDD